jgi:uncharacterized coiled-coil DUF342 family protein
MKRASAKKKPVGTSRQEVASLKKTVRELTRERDLYRNEWQKAMEEVVPFVMTQAEADAIRKDNITLDGMLKEIEPRLRKYRSS